MFSRSILRTARPTISSRPISRSVLLNQSTLDSLKDNLSKPMGAEGTMTANIDPKLNSTTSDLPPELKAHTDPEAGVKADKELRAQGRDLGKHEGDKASDGNGHIVADADN